MGTHHDPTSVSMNLAGPKEITTTLDPSEVNKASSTGSLNAADSSQDPLGPRSFIPLAPKSASVPLPSNPTGGECAPIRRRVSFVIQLERIFRDVSSDEVIAFFLCDHIGIEEAGRAIDQLSLKCRPNWLQLANNSFCPIT